MARHAYDFADDDKDGLVREVPPERSNDQGPMATARARAARGALPYGWCGLCRSFTVFPHDCPEADRPVDPEAP
jgi:hypothetical protein